MPETRLSPDDRIAIEDLMTALCRTVDARDPDALGALLTQDVAFDVGMGVLHGRDQVVEGFRGRAEDHSYVARHTWSNLTIESVDGDEVCLLSVFATFAHLGSGDDLQRVWRAGDSRDVVRREADGAWRLKSRALDIAMP